MPNCQRGPRFKNLRLTLPLSPKSSQTFQRAIWCCQKNPPSNYPKPSETTGASVAKVLDVHFLINISHCVVAAKLHTELKVSSSQCLAAELDPKMMGALSRSFVQNGAASEWALYSLEEKTPWDWVVQGPVFKTCNPKFLDVGIRSHEHLPSCKTVVFCFFQVFIPTFRLSWCCLFALHRRHLLPLLACSFLPPFFFLCCKSFLSSSPA